MKALKITYWVSTIFFATLFTTNGVLYLFHFATFARRATELYYPPYLLDIIGTAKILGGIALVTPRFKDLKEWAYAGFAFDFIGAIWSHFYVQGLGKGLPLLLPLSILTLSYITFHRLQKDPATAIVK